MTQLTLEQKDELVKLFYTVPTRQQTLEMCEAAIEKDKDAIKLVSKRLLSEELCIKAVKSNPESFFLIGKEYMSAELLYSFFKELNDRQLKRNDLLRDVESKFNRLKGVELKDLIDKRLAMEMVKFDVYSTRHFRKGLMTDFDILNIAVKKDGFAIRNIEKEQQTKELILNAVEGKISVSDIYEDLLDDEVADALVLKDRDYFSELPEDKQTYERCLLAVENGLLHTRVPRNFYTQELFDVMIKKRPYRIGAVPSEFLHRQMLLDVADESPEQLRRIEVREDLLDADFIKQLVNKGLSLEATWTREFQTKELVELAIKTNPLNVKYVKSEFMTKELAKQAVSEKPYLVKDIDMEYLDEEICYLAVLGGEGLQSRPIFELQSERIINKLIEKKYFTYDKHRVGRGNSSIANVKEEFRTKEFFKKVLELDKHALDYASTEVVDEELCYQAVCLGEHLDKDYMQRHQSQRIVDKAFEMGAWQLPCVKEEFLTKEVMVKAINHSDRAITDIPVEKLTEELAYAHVCKWEIYGKFIPENVESKRIVEKAFEKSKSSFRCFSNKYKTKEMSLEAFEYDSSFVSYMPEEFQTKEMWKICLGEAPRIHELVNHIPEKFCIDEVFQVLIDRQVRLITQIPTEYRTPNLLMYAFEKDAQALDYLV